MASENSIHAKFRRFCTQFKLDDKQIDELFEKVRQKRIKCAWCGKTLPKNGEEWNFPGGKIDISFEYGSRHDMDNINAHICDDCYEKRLLSTGIRPLTTNKKSKRNHD